MNTPAIENRSAPALDLLDIGVTNRPAEYRDGAEANRQNLAPIFDGQVMECWSNQGDEQKGYGT